MGLKAELGAVKQMNIANKPKFWNYRTAGTRPCCT